MKNKKYDISFVKKPFIMFCLLFISCYSFSQGELKIKSIAEEYKENVKEINKIEWKEVRIIIELYYEGSDIPPANMFLLSNNVLILKSRFYSKNMEIEENRFFRYKFENDILKLTAIDKRFDSERWIDVERYHKNNNSNVIEVNEENETVTYKYDDGFYFSGFLFYE